MGVNIISRDDSYARTFANRYSGAIHTSVEPGLCESVVPGLKIGVIEVGETAAFFNVEKNYGAFREAFLLGNFGGNVGLRGAEANGVLSGLDVARLFGIEQRYEAKALGLKERAFAEPGALRFAWWRTQPIAGEGIAFAKDWEGAVARIVIAIETEKSIR